VKTPVKIAVAAAGLVLGGGAVAAAVTTPEAASDGLSKATENSGIVVPVGESGDHPGPEDHPGGAPESVTVESDAAEAAAHGQEVSEVAQSDATEGREHGEAVSEVASGGRAGGDAVAPTAGQVPVDTPNDGGTDTADEASDGASEVGTSEAPEQAQAGSGNAGDHGTP